MRNSTLRKKSPAFRQGYHTGRDETLRAKIHTIKTGDNPESWQAYVDRMQDQKPEEYLAGDIEGYRRGYADRPDSGVSLFAVVVAMCLATVGGLFIGLAL